MQSTFRDRFRFGAHSKEVLRGAVASLLLKATGAVVAFLLSVVISRKYGAEGAGAFYLALTLATIASVLGRVGMDNVLVRWVAASRAVSDVAAISRLYRFVIQVLLAACAVATALFLSAAPWVTEALFHSKVSTQVIYVMALIVFPMSLCIVHAELFRGYGWISQSVFFQAIAIPGLGLLLIGLSGNDVTTAVAEYVVAAYVSAALALVLWQRGKERLDEAASRPWKKTFLKSAVPLYVASIADVVNNWAPIILLGLWGSMAEVGVLNAAARTALLISFVLIAINTAVAPKFAELYSRHDFDGLRKTAADANRVTLVCALPAAIIVLLFGDEIMALFGGDFKNGGTLLQVLAIGQLVNAATGSVGFLLMMTGHEKLMRRAVMYSLAINLFLGMALIPLFGGMGAAVAMAGTVMTVNLIAAVFVWRVLGIYPVGARLWMSLVGSPVVHMSHDAAEARREKEAS